MNTEIEPLDESYTPLKESAFADTSFLMHLLGIEGQVDQSDRLIKAQRRAEARFDEMCLNKQANFYWSPLVFSELIYSAARIIYRNKELQQKLGLEEVANQIRTDELAKHHKERAQPPPAFIKAALPHIRKKLTYFESRFRRTADVWESQGIDLWDVLEWGLLGAGDAVVALAAKESPANVLIADDAHFTKARQKLEELFKLQLLDIGDGL